jgi:phosphoglycerate dehydrogenase-like enzyme
MSISPDRLLIIHDGPDDYMDELVNRFPTLQIDTVAASESIPDAIIRVDPTIAMSFRAGRFPGPLHAPVFDAPHLKWFHSGGVGIDHLPTWDPKKLTVTNAAGVSGKYMAETVTGAVLMLNFGFPMHMENQRRKIWAPQTWHSLDQKTALVIGLGGIGERVAERLQSFGMYVIGARHSDKPCFTINEQITTRDILQTLPRADFVCIHVPNTPATFHLVNVEFLGAMKSDAYLINTARGAQVDDEALIKALTTGQIAGAYLDVFNEEPLPETSPYWDTPNLVISPHVSDSISGWEYNSAQFFAENIERYLAKKPLMNVCNPALGY